MTSRGIKLSLLVATLALPIALYLFLQGFGENKYVVPILYQQGILDPLDGCVPTSQAKLPEFSYRDVNNKTGDLNELGGSLQVISFVQHGCDPTAEALEEVARVANNYRNNLRVGVVTLQLDSLYRLEQWSRLHDSYDLTAEDWNLWHYNPYTIDLVRCAFKVETENCKAVERLLLLDGQLRIRGIYDAGEVEEVDRLITEVEILLLNREDV